MSDPPDSDKSLPPAPIFIKALFTEREFETVRRCCRDDDAPNPLRAFDAAIARAEGANRAELAVTITTPPPPSEPTQPQPTSLRVPLPPAPKGKP